jgi:hypothetical protein
MYEPNPLTDDFDSLDLATPAVDGPIPRRRLTSPSKLRSIHVLLREDDRINAYNRSLSQALLDGQPPYSEDELRNSNQPDTTNLNFQGAEKKLERAKAPYYRIINTGETLVKVRTLYGAEEERGDWEQAIEEEITRTIRGCPECFPYEAERLIHKYVWEGVAIAFWEDDNDWRFRASGMGQFYFPRQVAATESKQNIVTCEDAYPITDLYAKIDREDCEGWDREAVRLAITKATNAEPTYQNWELLMDEIKNNDLFVGTQLPRVRVIHGFVKEFSGKVSHYIISEDDCGEQTFLMKAEDGYSCMTEALIIFPYGTGTNTKLHGIRGLNYKVYPFEQQFNRSVGRAIDQGELASSLMLQADDETSYANMGLEYIGNLAALPPGFRVVEMNLPDLQKSVMPAIELMTQLGNERIAGYAQDNVFDGSQRKTKAEVMAHLEQSAELSSAELDFFYSPADRLAQQLVRRMTRREYVAQDPGGEEIVELRLNLVRRGVPLEAFYRLDWKRTSFTRIIGAGSAAARTIGLERMEILRPRMDDVGQNFLDRELAADAVGRENADLFFPKNMVKRTTTDTQVAVLQNFVLTNGGTAPVLSSDNHLAHAREHIKPLVEMYELAQGGQLPLAQAATTYSDLFAHTVEHLQMLEGDVSVSEEAAAMRQMLQRIEEVISNGIKEAEKLAQEQQATAQGQEQGGMSAEQQERFNKAQAEIELMRLKTRAGIEMEAEKNRARIAMDDAKTAADIRRKNITQQS